LLAQNRREGSIGITKEKQKKKDRATLAIGKKIRSLNSILAESFVRDKRGIFTLLSCDANKTKENEKKTILVEELPTGKKLSHQKTRSLSYD
jgi:hypothetical protein